MALLWKATGAMADSEGRIPVMELPWRVKISMKEGCGAAERLRNCWSFGERDTCNIHMGMQPEIMEDINY
jgi:hypothetical protein